MPHFEFVTAVGSFQTAYCIENISYWAVHEKNLTQNIITYLLVGATIILHNNSL